MQFIALRVATATEATAATRITMANCAFHLNNIMAINLEY